MPKPKYNKAKADKLFSELIRRKGYCEKCGSTYRIQCAHIISRRYHSTRWDSDNALCLCEKCHLYYTWHPLEWEDYITSKIGADHFNALRTRALAYTKIDYKETIARLVGELNG